MPGYPNFSALVMRRRLFHRIHHVLSHSPKNHALALEQITRTYAEAAGLALSPAELSLAHRPVLLPHDPVALRVVQQAVDDVLSD